ncbi:MAG: isocitrate lyase/phosphoenolpyruvate mutase family protein [Deltaproteobacteria bacterium]|nr:isocitrate lyase/phosphoenolpyruvate mutase family protein [Deltaproteobacteria bacterium]
MTSPAAAFRALHTSGCFVMPNAWDVGSAILLHRLGFRAIASTSAGLAFSRGLPDSMTALSRDVVLAHLRELVAATPLPVNADYQSGYAKDAAGVAESVALCMETGVAGLSIEDASGDTSAPLYALDVALDRLRAARRAIDHASRDALLTARCEAYLVGDPDPAKTSIDRLVAYADAGADCLFAPGVRDVATIGAMVKAVAPRPLNVIVTAPSPELTVARLADLGVRRISAGSALARAAWGAFLRAATEIAQAGTFDALASAATFAELNTAFGR